MTVHWLGVTWPVFVGLTVFLFGFAALMTGHALAQTWRPYWHAVPYSMLLGFGAQFLGWSLFDGEWRFLGWLIESAVLLAIGLTAYRVTRAHKMVTQYPWLYERAGLFGWREKGHGT